MEQHLYISCQLPDSPWTSSTTPERSNRKNSKQQGIRRLHSSRSKRAGTPALIFQTSL